MTCMTCTCTCRSSTKELAAAFNKLQKRGQDEVSGSAAPSQQWWVPGSSAGSTVPDVEMAWPAEETWSHLQDHEDEEEEEEEQEEDEVDDFPAAQASPAPTRDFPSSERPHPCIDLDAESPDAQGHATAGVLAEHHHDEAATAGHDGQGHATSGVHAEHQHDQAATHGHDAEGHVSSGVPSEHLHDQPATHGHDAEGHVPSGSPAEHQHDQAATENATHGHDTKEHDDHKENATEAAEGDPAHAHAAAEAAEGDHARAHAAAHEPKVDDHAHAPETPAGHHALVEAAAAPETSGGLHVHGVAESTPRVAAPEPAEPEGPSLKAEDGPDSKLDRKDQTLLINWLNRRSSAKKLTAGAKEEAVNAKKLYLTLSAAQKVAEPCSCR